MAPDLGRGADNAGRVDREIRAAADEGARLVVFPEAALTGYLFRSREEALAGAVTAAGPELEAVAEACREARVWAVVGAIERADGEGGGPGVPGGTRDGEAPVLHNTAFVVGPDGPAGRQRKVHTLCLGADRFTRPGTEPLRMFDLPIGRIGVHICYDGSFPETARALRLAGARLLLLPTNWPDLDVKTELVRVRAYENHAFYLAVNRTGTERGVRFRGGSCAADPFGRLLLRAGPDPGRYQLEVDLAAAEKSRVVVRPGEYEYDRLADRRPGAYGPLAAPAPDAEPDGGPTGSRQAEPPRRRGGAADEGP